MTTIGICRCKDEADIILSTIRHMMTQVDEIIVMDNGSTDGTREMLEALPITLIDDPEIAYYQSVKMTQLAHVAGEKGADWIIPFDADEIAYSIFGRLADILSDLGHVMIAEAELYDHVATINDLGERNPVKRMTYRRKDAARLPKVACRYREDLVIEAGNHEATYDGPVDTARNVYTIRHFPYRSADQMLRKVQNGSTAYALTDLPAHTGAHWRAYGEILASQGEKSVKDIFRMWFWSVDPERDGLIYDPCPIGVKA